MFQDGNGIFEFQSGDLAGSHIIAWGLATAGPVGV